MKRSYSDLMGPNLDSSVSSAWIRPDVIMMSHRAKKKALQKRFTAKSQFSTFNDSSAATHTEDNMGIYNNPFRVAQPSEPAKVLASTNEDTSDLTNDIEELMFGVLERQYSSNDLKYSTPLSFKGVLEKQNLKAAEETWSYFLPVDWSLKSRIRFTTPQALPALKFFATSEVSSSTTHFVRCLDTHRCENLDENFRSKFLQHTYYWQHPNLPWLTEFPHMGKEQGEKFNIPTAMRKILLTEWRESLRMLYQLIRTRQCPYFYIICNVYTILVRAAGIASIPGIHALISPGSNAIRKALLSYDVTYTLPLLKVQKKDADSPNTSTTDTGYSTAMEEDGVKSSVDDDEDSKKIVDEEPSEWLAELGIDMDTLPGMESSKMREDTKFSSEKHPESLILVTDGEIEGVIDYLMETDVIVPISGPLAGVPPAIIAPVAFRNAAFKSLNIKDGTVLRGTEMHRSIEIQGPILPHMFQNICHLLSNSVDEFLATLTTTVHSEPFAITPTPIESKENVSIAFSKENLSDCGLEDSLLEKFCTVIDRNNKQLHEIKCKNKLYLC